MLDLVYPPHCLVCGAWDTPMLCDTCRAGFVPVTGSVCPKCGKPFVESRCHTCFSAEQEGGWHFDKARGAFYYDGTIADAIQKLKYTKRELLAEPLGDCFAERLQTGAVLSLDEMSRIQAIVPVPLHPSRLRERGFNQAELLSRPIAKVWNVPLLPHTLHRAKKTKQQARLNGAERRANMTGEIFIVRNTAQVAGRGILLVDDVMTTGATLSACANALKAAGATSVYAVTLAISGQS